MFYTLSQSIQKYARFSKEELSLLEEKVKLRALTKNEIILQKGEVCKVMHFVLSGALRQYYYKDDLDEITMNLYTENDWVINCRSFTSQSPSESIIQAFEDSHVFTLHMDDIHELISHSPAFFQLGKILEPSSAPMINQTPEEKYKYLLTTRPIIIRTFPLKHIASYLKITPETLSRVRKKISSRQD